MRTISGQDRLIVSSLPLSNECTLFVYASFSLERRLLSSLARASRLNKFLARPTNFRLIIKSGSRGLRTEVRLSFGNLNFRESDLSRGERPSSPLFTKLSPFFFSLSLSSSLLFSRDKRFDITGASSRKPKRCRRQPVQFGRVTPGSIEAVTAYRPSFFSFYLLSTSSNLPTPPASSLYSLFSLSLSLSLSL